MLPAQSQGVVPGAARIDQFFLVWARPAGQNRARICRRVRSIAVRSIRGAWNGQFDFGEARAGGSAAPVNRRSAADDFHQGETQHGKGKTE
jgi:hypothetical protein